MSDLPVYIDEIGQPRRLGCLPKGNDRVAGPPPADPSVWLYPASELRRLCGLVADQMRSRAERLKDDDQDGVGKCCLSTYTHCEQLLRFRAGHEREKLSSDYGYHWTVDRRGKIAERTDDDGESMANGLFIVREKGLVLASRIPNLDWRGRNWPPAEELEAESRDFRVLEWVDVSASMEMILSLLARPKPVAHGYNGHARTLLAPTTNEYDREEIPFLQSYGRDWGDNGIGKLSFRQVDQGRPGYGAFAGVSVVDPANDGDVRQ